jgi:hypothetical protein
MVKGITYARAAFAGLCLIALGGCSDLSVTQQRVLSGGSIGSATGIAATVLTGGCIPCGGAIGSLVGSGAGYAYDQYEKSENDKNGASKFTQASK